jgi:hypothetical protein
MRAGHYRGITAGNASLRIGVTPLQVTSWSPVMRERHRRCPQGSDVPIEDLTGNRQMGLVRIPAARAAAMLDRTSGPPEAKDLRLPHTKGPSMGLKGSVYGEENAFLLQIIICH